MTTPFGYFDLLEAFPLPGCAVCRLLDQDVDRYLDRLLYEYPTDPITQQTLRASRGLCHEHGWRLRRYNNALSVAVLYDAVVDELMRISLQVPADRGRSRRRGAGSALADALAPTQPCPACALRDDAEKRYLQILGEYVSEARFGDAFRQSDGLCLPHFRGALEGAHDAESARLLATVQSASWGKLKGELEMFMHKMDAHYHERMGAEGTSWLRALARVAGEKRTE